MYHQNELTVLISNYCMGGAENDIRTYTDWRQSATACKKKQKQKQTVVGVFVFIFLIYLFIYLFIYSFVSLSWRYKPPQPELPRIPSLKCRVHTASPKRQERRYFNLEPGDADHLSRFVKGRLFCRQFALSVHVIKILLVKTLLSVLLPMINWMLPSEDKIHSCCTVL